MGHWEVTETIVAGTRVGTIVDRGSVGDGFDK
jgi:hypothetical protein